MKPRIVELTRFVADSLTCTGQLRRPGDVTTNPATGEVETSFELIFDGPCLVYPEDTATVIEVATAEDTLSRYSVTLPAGVDAQPGDVLVVTTSPHAADLVGQQLRITDAPLNAWQIALTCTAEHLT